ncbi:hypothetical protein [Saccharomonospora glauca]|uniref:Uncharacterized protein n=1 Tax=Saccharomonospora glauca K62 TaxID=928724 RepID=I1D541_9PSEU|nr:hypothetical protein [Saccharomonospora glauca]EIF00066.1 hypothetical protein SacglDRAFT_03200 [Saccharomonospora glauca K62]
MRVTADDVRALFASDDPSARLVLHEGAFRVLGERELDAPDYAGALEVIRRDDLRDQFGEREPSAAEYERIAAGLDVGISNQGG